jgi:hypothetical protein
MVRYAEECCEIAVLTDGIELMIETSIYIFK